MPGVPDLEALGRLLPPHLLALEREVAPVPGLRPASTLLLLHPVGGEPGLLFTRRSMTVGSHQGQISFPGGAREPLDRDLATTALREATEEVGIDPRMVRLIGRLADLPSISYYQVVPFVGLSRQPVVPVVDPDEVAEVIQVPLRHLLSPGVFSRTPRLVEGRPVPTYSYEYDGHVIWGLTARILRDFLSAFRAATKLEMVE